MQWCGRYLVLWWDIVSTVEDVHHCGGISSVLWRLFSTLEDNISTMENIKYCGNTISELRMLITMEETITDVKGIQLIGGYH